ncbi:hypothetical protein [Dyella choica]|uniref:Uncharacterized protein n=1 Tax=Dyella choica TaxID=1927959 RepID=A0A3S0Q2S7_9GAMM|nr:hypothetical protein [Dyella choica]RUL71474.1 hypothetical protein EKH80_19000 [Dyella choica]
MQPKNVAPFKSTCLALTAMLSLHCVDVMAMTYHDNKVTFSAITQPGISLSVGSHYEVEDFSVTSGQDPNGKIYKGLYNDLVPGESRPEEGPMIPTLSTTFSVGRKGSSQVAAWFNDKIHANQNTFGHGADQLNFAFIGTLTLQLQQGTFTLPGIALAQGHAGATNNWWFGGQTCTYLDGSILGYDHTSVKCVATNADGSKWTITFLRGANDVSEVEITKVTPA